MTLEETTKLYEMVLRQLLPVGGYDRAPNTDTAPCNSPVNTEQLRYKVKLVLQSPVEADMDCIIYNYLPAYVRYDIEVI